MSESERSVGATFKPIGQDNHSSHLIGKSLFLTRALLEPSVDHGAMGDSGSESFIKALNRHVRHLPAKLPYEGFDIAGAFRILTAHRLGESDDNSVDTLFCAIILQECHQIARALCRQSVGGNTQGIRHGYAATFPSVINCKNASHPESDEMCNPIIAIAGEKIYDRNLNHSVATRLQTH